MDGVAPQGVGLIEDDFAHKDVLSLIGSAMGLNPDATPVRN
jgi:hypothetical protein